MEALSLIFLRLTLSHNVGVSSRNFLGGVSSPLRQSFPELCASGQTLNALFRLFRRTSAFYLPRAHGSG